jgi:hypothetical protein
MSKALPIPVIKATSTAPLVAQLKSYQNCLIEAQSVKRFSHGVCDTIRLAPNSSGIVKIQLEDKRQGFPLYTLQCSDSLGGLNHYLLSIEDQTMNVLLENLTASEREIRLFYRIFYDSS